MTLLQPSSSHPFLNKVIFLLVCALMAQALWLVMLYNHVVNVAHAITQVKSDMRTLQTESAELKDTIFALFDSEHLQAFAESRALVQERNPRYLPLQAQAPEKLAER